MPAFSSYAGSMPALPDIESLDHPAMVALLIRAFERIDELERIVEKLSQGAKSSATPFSKGKGKKNPKKSGRKRGEGDFKQRAAPEPEDITEPVVKVPIDDSVTACPKCNGELGPVREEMVYKTDLPKEFMLEVTAYLVSACNCLECGSSVRGQHPEVAPDQYGASAHRLGHRFFAAAYLMQAVAGSGRA